MEHEERFEGWWKKKELVDEHFDVQGEASVVRLFVLCGTFSTCILHMNIYIAFMYPCSRRVLEVWKGEVSPPLGECFPAWRRRSILVSIGVAGVGQCRIVFGDVPER